MPNPDDSKVQVLDAHAGYELVASDEWLWCFDRRTYGPGIAAAVSGGVAGIVGINALVFLLAALGGSPLGPWPIIVVESALVLIAAAVCSFSLRLRQRRFAQPRAELRPLLQVDRRAAMVLDGQGRPLAPLAQAAAGRGMQMGSSAPALFVYLPGRSRLRVFRGSLFGGGIDRARSALGRIGFQVR